MKKIKVLSFNIIHTTNGNEDVPTQVPTLGYEAFQSIIEPAVYMFKCKFEDSFKIYSKGAFYVDYTVERM